MSPYSEFELYLMEHGFSERDVKEIAFATLYAEAFAHGTDGHNRLLIINRLANLVSELSHVKKD